jgi:predicted nucleic acid-binding protein
MGMLLAVSKLEGLTPEAKKQALLRLSQFVLRETSSDIRKSIYRQILENGIYLSAKTDQKTNIENVLKLIEDQFFGVKLELDTALVYLKQLRDEGIVTIVEKQILLREDVKTHIEEYSKKTLSLVSSYEAEFIKKVFEKAKETATQENIALLKDCYYQFVVEIVSRYIVDTAKYFIQGTLRKINRINGEKIVDNCTRILQNINIKEAAMATLLELMQSPDEEFIEYLFVMRQNFLCIEVLNLDPDCRIVQKEEFSKKQLFLDTNVILSLVISSEDQWQIRKLVENSIMLGCRVFVTKRTLKEYAVLFDRTKSTLEALRATPNQLAMATNPFIRSYGKLLANNEASSIDEFMGKYSDLTKILVSFGVEIYEKEHDEIPKLPSYDGLVREIQLCFYRLRDKPKSDEVAKHDAFHLLLMKELREPNKASLLGPDSWFLTCDLTLPLTDKYLRTEFDFSDKTSPIMIPSIWNEIISPFLVGIVTQKDLIEVFKSFISSDFTPTSEGINAGVLAKLEIDWSEYDWVENEEIQKITNMQFVLQYLTKAEELTKVGDFKELENLRHEFNLEFSKIIGDLSRRKIAVAQQQLAKKTQEAESLVGAVEELETVQTNLSKDLSSERVARTKATTLSLRMRYIAGVLGIILVSVGTILTVLLKETASLQIVIAYSVFFLVGAILLLMSIAPERVSGIVGVGRGK